MVTKAVFLLAVVGMASICGLAMADDGDTPAPVSTDGRHPPTFFLMQVVNGSDVAEGLAPEGMERDWRARTLSQDPLRVKAELVARYAEAGNEGRKCARVKGSIGQDKVPLKGSTYQDCTGGKAGVACKPFYVISELDMCGDGLPPTANYEKYKDQAADKQWKPPVTELKGDKP